MIINQKQSEVEILQTGNNDTIDMSLDMNSANILMNMLSKNLYSDSIGSAIRETVSNSLDSHRRAKCKKPIIVSLKINEEGDCEFSSEDFGTGLDDDDVRNIISKYGMSTKREEANSLGAMGQQN
jgi:HSP90 family molecular chaperone